MSVGILDWIFSDSGKVTDEDVAYYREHPDEIDEVTAPVNIHKFFLLIGFSLGALFLALSKAVKFSGILDFAHSAVEEFIVDIVLEIGVALIGATIVAYVMVVVLNEQQESAKKWRDEITKRISESGKSS